MFTHFLVTAPDLRGSWLANEEREMPSPRLARLLAPSPAPAARPRRHPVLAMASHDKIVWLAPSTQDALTAGLEAGFATVLAPSTSAAQLQAWRALGRFTAVLEHADGRLVGEAGEAVGRVRHLRNAADLAAAEADAAAPGAVVMRNGEDDWHIIPAENLVAAFQGRPATLLAAAGCAADARVMLTALEAGADGVVLETGDAAEVRALAAYLRTRQGGAERLEYAAARVTAVRCVGMGDRACVDLAAAMAPGEGLLVGSFARALFLVHSECAESGYIASRPFRVNAGPVHAYCQAPGGRTRYLSELRSGDEVAVADARGGQRVAVVGRVKIESRPLVLVEAVTPDGQAHSHLLQNAETVRLVGPAGEGEGGDEGGWRAVSVSELAPGDEVFILRQGGARHTGISIEESIVER